jgi:hypothetical protein
MNKLALAAAAATLMMAGSANAMITVSQSAYYTYADDVLAFSDSKVVCSFDAACASGYNFTFAGGSPAPGTGIYTGSSNGVTAAPPGDGTAYASVLGPDGTATLTFSAGVKNISFFMGSPDQYNAITFYDAGNNPLGTFNGTEFTGPPANGDQGLGERITFNFNGAAVTKATFGSSQNSFEFDRVGAAVPEPTSWALMILGFGGIGAAIRSRRRLLATA